MDVRSRHPSASRTKGSETPCTNTSSAPQPVIVPDKDQNICHTIRMTIHAPVHREASHHDLPGFSWSLRNRAPGWKAGPLVPEFTTTKRIVEDSHAQRVSASGEHLMLRLCPPCALLGDHSAPNGGAAAGYRCDRPLPCQHDVQCAGEGTSRWSYVQDCDRTRILCVCFTSFPVDDPRNPDLRNRPSPATSSASPQLPVDLQGAEKHPYFLCSSVGYQVGVVCPYQGLTGCQYIASGL